MREETGLDLPEVGPELWIRDHDLRSYGLQILQRERYFLVAAAPFTPRPDSLQNGDERAWFRGFRWWPVEELPDFGADFAPTMLGQLTRKLLDTGPPAKPFPIGV